MHTLCMTVKGSCVIIVLTVISSYALKGKQTPKKIRIHITVQVLSKECHIQCLIQSQWQWRFCKKIIVLNQLRWLKRFILWDLLQRSCFLFHSVCLQHHGWMLGVWQQRLNFPTNIPLHFVALWQMAAEGQSDNMVSNMEVHMKQKCGI